jgi:hypothetical protein
MDPLHPWIPKAADGELSPMGERTIDGDAVM